ncbi:MAG TPA: hypothetical protein VM345_01955 [Acidimicrobiales bacterium]|nr:hypothetical protein [Acidimicrobiales bacterium]
MSVAVVIPWKAGCPHRERALRWVRNRYETLGLPVVAGVVDGEWCKADAVAAGLALTDATMVVVADADVWCSQLPDAIDAVAAGAAWAVPHDRVHRLTETSTELVLAGCEPNRSMECDERPYRGRAGGGILVIHRALYRQAPFDARFVGWGQEDDAAAVAWSTLFGPSWRGSSPLWHLWHPPQQRMNRVRGSDASWALYRRYVAARRNPERMRSLIGEVVTV